MAFKMKGFPFAGKSPVKNRIRGYDETGHNQAHDDHDKGKGPDPHEGETPMAHRRNQQLGASGKNEQLVAEHNRKHEEGEWDSNHKSTKPLKKKEKTPMYQKEKKTYPKSYTKEDIKFLEEQNEDVVREGDKSKVQYAGGDVINTKEYKQALKDGVKSESEFAAYKQMGREAWMKKNKKKK